jgi:hypothetical protein
MKDTQHNPIYLKDYQPPAYLVESVELIFELGEIVYVRGRTKSTHRNHN